MHSIFFLTPFYLFILFIIVVMTAWRRVFYSCFTCKYHSVHMLHIQHTYSARQEVRSKLKWYPALLERTGLCIAVSWRTEKTSLPTGGPHVFWLRPGFALHLFWARWKGHEVLGRLVRSESDRELRYRRTIEDHGWDARRGTRRWGWPNDDLEQWFSTWGLSRDQEVRASNSGFHTIRYLTTSLNLLWYSLT